MIQRDAMLTAGWGGVGWDFKVLTTTSLILRCHRMLIPPTRKTLMMQRDATLTVRWGGVGWGINVLTTTSLILRCHRMFHQLGKELGKLCKEQVCKELGKLCKWRAWMWKMTLMPLLAGQRCHFCSFFLSDSVCPVREFYLIYSLQTINSPEILLQSAVWLTNQVAVHNSGECNNYGWDNRSSRWWHPLRMVTTHVREKLDLLKGLHMESREEEPQQEITLTPDWSECGLTQSPHCQTEGSGLTVVRLFDSEPSLHGLTIVGLGSLIL